MAGIAPALPLGDYSRYDAWQREGMAGEMRYLTDRRGELRVDPRNLLPTAQTILCVGKLYNKPAPYSSGISDRSQGWIARYAWGDDYHDAMRSALAQVVEELSAQVAEPFDWRICVDTAPLLERSLARLAGLGWIGKNTCLINQDQGSWFLLGELLLSLPLASDAPPPDRCGSCTRCIDTCPTDALVTDAEGNFRLDSRLCISYLTIEKRGDLPADMEAQLGHHVFGCDICQDVCPWNRRAPELNLSVEGWLAPSLADLANLTEEEFRQKFRSSVVWRSKYSGFLRNVAIAMGNSGQRDLIQPLKKLMTQPDPLIAETAERALSRLLERVSHE